MDFTYKDWVLNYKGQEVTLSTDETCWYVESSDVVVCEGIPIGKLASGCLVEVASVANLLNLPSISVIDHDILSALAESHTVYFLRSDDCVVAVAGVNINGDLPYLNAFFTPEDYRGTGHATILLRFLTQHYMCMYAHVSTSNAASIKAMQKAGFVTECILPLFYVEDAVYRAAGVNHDALLMTFNLKLGTTHDK